MNGKEKVIIKRKVIIKKKIQQHLTDSFSEQKLKNMLKLYGISFYNKANIEYLKILCKMKIYNLDMKNEWQIITRKIQAEYKIYNFMIYNYLKKLGNCSRILKSCCINHDDIGTGDPVGKIPDVYLLLEESEGYYYAFYIRSLFLYQLKSNDFTNPYTGKSFNSNFMITYDRKLSFLKRNNWHVLFLDACLSDEQMNRIKILDVFQKINHLGFYVKHEWFTNLSYKRYIKLYYYLSILMNKNLAVVSRVVNTPIFQEMESIRKLENQESDVNKKQIIQKLITDIDILISEGKTKSDRINSVLWFLAVFIRICPEAKPYLSFLIN